MAIVLKQLNNHIIKPVKIKIDSRKIKAADIFPDLYGNMFLVAPTNTGKTTLLAYLLDKMAGKGTRIVIFCSTFYNDPIWSEIRKGLEKKGVPVEIFTSIKDNDGNHLKELVDELREDAEAQEEEKEKGLESDIKVKPTTEELLNQLRRDNGVKEYFENKINEDGEEEPRPKKCKYAYPKIIVVFDDISDELKHPDYNSLLKQARHYCIRTITSSQYLKDISPSARLQIRGWILFANMSDIQLEDLHKSLALRLPLNAFLDIYKFATIPDKNNPKPFLYMLPKIEEYRKGLTHKFDIPQSVYDANNI